MVRRRKSRTRPWELASALDPLRRAWHEAVDVPRRRAAVALGALVVVVAMALARAGTTRARVGAVGVMLGVGAVVAALRWRERRRLAAPGTAVVRLAGAVEPERAARALRALSLLNDAGEPRDARTSPVLARLHVSRALAALPEDRIAERARAVGRTFAWATYALAFGAGLGVVLDPWGFFEGLDVLIARRGVAPVGMRWLVDPELRARPPDYLHQEERGYPHQGDRTFARGTLLTVKGVPAHAGRRLFLSDGARDVPFVDDGTGAVIARWPVAADVTLHVVARFGAVVIEEPEFLHVTSIADEAPTVTLDSAPREARLADGDMTTVPILYVATDDHGLREVHLVLRAGSREDRRVLAHLDGETRRDSGGYFLRTNDAFIKKSHVPVQVSVEAKDNDPITGPKWGASPAITLIPPDVGEPEARRLDALRKLRDRLVDGLAWRIEHPLPAGGAARTAMIADETRGVSDDDVAVRDALTSWYGGLEVAPRLRAMVLGAMRRVSEGMRAEARAPSDETHASLVRSTEKLVIVIDGVVRGLGQRDARAAAKQLADVADDLAFGLVQAQRADAGRIEVEGASARADAAVSVLAGGRRQLASLGALGRDLGEIVGADLARVARARGAPPPDWRHAELAARDLALRLHQPDPSFGARGQFGHGGGESGGGRGSAGGDEQGESEGERAFNEAAQELERLAGDHAAEIGKVDQAVGSADTRDEQRAFAREAAEHAQAVRDATRGLPSVSVGSDSWTSKGAAAREHAEHMAMSFEDGNAANAVASGRSAMEALEAARHMTAKERFHGFGDPSAQGGERRIDDARKKLEPEVKWAERRLAELRKLAAQRASGELAKAGEEEGELADRARQLGDKGHDEGALPGGALQPLAVAEAEAREAASALRAGDADRSLAHQREAQRQLELAKEALGGDDAAQESPAEGGDEGTLGRGHADIPGADAHKGPEEFRRRVLKGLGQGSGGKHKDAVKRYAEGLLR